MSGLVKHGGLRGYPCASRRSPGRCAWCGGWVEGVQLCGVRNAQAAEDLRDTIGDICGEALAREQAIREAREALFAEVARWDMELPYPSLPMGVIRAARAYRDAWKDNS